MPSNWSSVVCRAGPSWPGLTNLRNLVVFGASYCDVGFLAQRSPWPTSSQPLGVTFPGTTWAENSAANWVGHICDAFRREGYQPPRVYDLAHGGQQVDGVAMQIRREFFGDLGRRWEAGGGAKEGFWRGDDTLFAIWVGINDCALIGVDGVARALETYFRLVKELYESGARNFMLVDLPPLRRIPATRGRMPVDKQAYEEWNDILHTKATEFAATHDDVTMVVYSSWQTLTRVLDEYSQYGFTLEDTQRGGSRIWADELHPTSKVHEIVAQDMLALLRTVSVPSAAD